MLNQFSRTQLLLGPEAMECLAEARVAVFGVVDAIDTVKGKLALVEQAQAAHTPVILQSDCSLWSAVNPTCKG